MARLRATAGAPEASTSAELRQAALRSLAGQTPVNTVVTILASLGTAAMLWPEAPRPWLLLWAGLHAGLASLLLWRWAAYRRRGTAPRGSERGLRRAKRWALVAGLLWGSTAGFLPVVPTAQQMAVVIVIASMASGASTTLAAVPQAGALFIAASLVPVAVFFLWHGDPVHLGLALLAMMMTLAMIGSTRVVYTSLLEQLAAKRAAVELLEELRAAEAEWLEISATADAFALFDADDRLLLWNDNYGRVLSLPAARLERGSERVALLRAASPPVAVATGEVTPEAWIEEQLHLHEHPDEPVVHQLANGRWVRSRARRNDRGHTVTLHLDVTELKEAEEALRQRDVELRQAQRLDAIGKLAGGVAHDFNNLLTIITGYCERLEQLLEPGHPGAAHVDQIAHAARRAARLTGQLLAFGRRQTMQPRVVDLNALVRELGGLMRSVLPESIELKLDLPSDKLPAKVDPGQLEQVLVNLVVNARDAMPEGGQLWLSTAAAELEADDRRLDADCPPGSYATLTVRDDGCGMSEETLQRIFEPFFTLKPEGAGLGLATVHGIVKQSGGTVSVESAPGRGTAFTVALPRAAAPIADEASGLAPPEVEPPAPRPSAVILLVEDEDTLRGLLREVLEAQGLAVLDTGKPREAIALCEGHRGRIDLLISDVIMPEMGGPALARKARDVHGPLKVLFISGYTADALGDEGVLDENTHLLQKPFSPQALARRVGEVLAAVPAPPNGPNGAPPAAASQ